MKINYETQFKTSINSIHNFARQNCRANGGYKLSFLGPVLIAAIILSACTNPTVQHPGAINAFDNTAYDTLITEQAAIEQAKVNIAQFPQFKNQLNNVIAQYNVTMEAYKVYHNAGALGDISSLQSKISSLVTNVAALVKSMIPVAPKVP